ncbi:MAG: TIGR00296 family protein [Methanoregula sp.]|nr:TIGR00296 family protein [Methanoregula sp.]
MQLLTPDEGKLAVRLARGAIEYTIAKTPKPMVDLTPVFAEKRGVFVTLTKAGQLRGCIGFPYPMIPLGEAIENAAVAAALEDPRFPGVKRDELGTLDFEVTVLTPPVPLTCDPADRPKHIEVGRHGLIARGYGTSGLLLPQVATEYNWDAKTFLDQTCEKAGLPTTCWQQKIIEILTFEGQIFTGTFKGSV